MPLDPTLTMYDLRSEVTRLQVLADARLYRARAARIALESVGIPRHEPVDVGAARAAGIIEDLRAEVARLRSELAAAQAAPVVEWYATTVGEAARVGMFWMSIGPGGWTLRVRLPYGFGAGELIEEGPETGPAGKAACEAAYRRVCGLPAIPACAG